MSQGLGYMDPVDLEVYRVIAEAKLTEWEERLVPGGEGIGERERNLGLYSYRAGVIYMYVQCNPTIDALSHSPCESERSAGGQ
jgi:hypothetical protein